MKLFYFVILIPIIFSACSSNKSVVKTDKENEQQAYNIHCVGFYNFENLFDTINQDNVRDDDFTPSGSYAYTGKIYEEKLGNLSYVISKLGTELTPLGPTLLGVCEIENKGVLSDFVKQKSIVDRNYKIVHYDSPDKRGIDVALLYNPSHFSVIESGTITPKLFYDNENDGKDVAERDTVFTRDMLWVKGKLDGDEVYVIVCHWPSRRGGSYLREGTARFCKHFTDSILADQPNAKIIVMGDLNDDPISPSVKNVMQAKFSKDQVQKQQFFNPSYELYRKGLGTLAWNDAWNLFDQILVSEGLLHDTDGYKFFKYDRFYKSFLVNQAGNWKGYPFRTYVAGKYQGGFSDHLPVCVYLVKKK